MLSRRLYLQIYATILASLFLVVVIAALSWHLFGERGFGDRAFDRAAALAEMVVAPPDAPPDVQRAAVRRLGSALDADVSLFARDGSLMASHGVVIARPQDMQEHRILKRRAGSARFALPLSDGRLLAIDLKKDHKPLLGLLLLFGSVAAGIGLASYPFVRRVTGRLERLQRGVDRVGSGELSARVKVEGRDEIAGLATSFNHAAERIQTLVGSQRLLLANASHELRTPLARIRMGIEMLGGEGDAERTRADLKRDISDLNVLIEQLLMMTRLDAETDAGHFERIDLLALAAEECARYDDCTLTGVPSEVAGDRHLLQCLIRNLLENAQRHGKPPVELQMARTGDMVALVVEDAGNGIADGGTDRVFEPFFRGAGRQNVPGSGLGLALVRQIAQTHGGTADLVRNARGKWRVRVALPLVST